MEELGFSRSQLRVRPGLGFHTPAVQQPAGDYCLTGDLLPEVGLAQHAAGVAAPHQHINFDA